MQNSTQNLLEATPQKKAANRLMQLLKEAISLGKFEVGQRIPSERKLSEYYDAPLHAVRLAIGQLKEDSILESRPKSGVYVIDVPGPDYTSEDNEFDHGEATFSGANSFSANEESSFSTSFSTIDNSAANTYKTKYKTAQTDGFSLIGRPMQTKTTLHFAIVGWYSGNRGLWEKICAEYELESGGKVEIIPHFPENQQQYEALQQSCDIFICVHHNLAAAGLEHLVAPIDLDILQNAGIQQRYIDAVDLGNNSAIGMPLSATLLMGFLDKKLLSKKNIKRIEAAKDMTEALDYLSSIEKDIKSDFVFNMCPETCFNTMQLLFAQGSPILNSATGKIDLSSASSRGAIEAVDSFINKVPNIPGDVWRPTNKEFSVLLDYVPQTEQLINSPRFKPWGYPLAKNGKYLEGLNVGMVSSSCIDFESATKFLSYLTAPSSQQHLYSTTKEYPVSQLVDNQFAAYPDNYQKIIAQMRQNAIVDGEFVPGYSKVLQEVFYPAARLWFSGNIKAKDFITIVEQRGNAHLKRAANEAAQQRSKRTKDLGRTGVSGTGVPPVNNNREYSNYPATFEAKDNNYRYFETNKQNEITQTNEQLMACT